MRLALALALLSGCGFIIARPGQPKPTCVSVCGQKLFGLQDCAAFQNAEDRALGYLGPLFGGGINVCRRLRDWKVDAAHSAPWLDRWDRDGDGKKDTVGGLSGCDINPGQNGWAEVLSDWHALSYFHEVAHHLECPREVLNCKELWPAERFEAIREAAAQGAVVGPQ